MKPSSSSPGRPRSEKTRQAILSAAFAILAERGYDAMSLESVAGRAGAGKTTIYRWWAGKAELAVDAFFNETKAELSLPDTGSSRDDFKTQIKQLALLLAGPRGVVFAAMLGGARSDPTLAKALGERWLEPRRKWGLARIKKAVAAGECREDVDAGAALGILYGPLYAPLLFGQVVPSTSQVDAHLKIALDAIFKVE